MVEVDRRRGRVGMRRRKGTCGVSGGQLKMRSVSEDDMSVGWWMCPVLKKD